MVKFLIVITGPTGVGKTDMSIDIAEKYHTEIISCDSRQFYKELNIGTAKPGLEQMKRVRHHFINHISIHDYYNASKFEFEALGLLKKLFRKKHLVIMTGGSGLYIDAVCEGIDDLPPVNFDVREKLEKEYQEKGIENLRMKLKILDPEHYRKVDLRNHKRILKALEICLQTGKPYSKWLRKENKKRDFKIIKIGLMKNRDLLYAGINERVNRMIGSGLIEEAKNLYQYRNMNSLNTVGYKELFRYFDGDITKEKAIELIKRNSRRYARKQLTWFNRYDDIRWFEPGEHEKIFNYINGQLHNENRKD